MWTFALLLACSTTPPDEELPPDPVAEVSAQGPHAVGYVHTEITYRPVGADADRTLPVEVWYPAAAAGEGLVTYLVAGFAEQESKYALDAPAAADGAFPVALYSHGSGGLGMIGYPYGERMASHGWIVVSPDHVGNTSFDLLSGTEDSFVQIMLHRPADVSATLDAVDAGITDALADHADMDRVFVFGHSFGGWTTFATRSAIAADAFAQGCQPDDTDPDCALLNDPVQRDLLATGHIDDRVDLLGTQAPAIIDGFAEGALAGIGVPVLMMSAGRDQTTPDETEASVAWPQLNQPDDVWVRIPNGGHYSFISVCDDLGVDTIAVFEPGAVNDGCGPDFTPTAETVPALASYLLAFAGGHLGDRPDWLPVLDVALTENFKIKRHE